MDKPPARPSTLNSQPSTIPDCFALLNQPRRPWLDVEALKQQFLSISASVHPDRVHNAAEAEKRAAQERYAELNAAYNCLREPKARLQHLLELERGMPPGQLQRIPDDLMDFSMKVARLCRDTDAFLAEKGKTTSPLLRVRLFQRAQELNEQLTALWREISARREQIESDIKALDSAWPNCTLAGSAERDAALERLEALWRLLGFLSRWGAQIQERQVQLAF